MFPAAHLTVEGSGPYTLRGRITGGAIDRGHTALRADAKAVTFHQLQVVRAPVGWRARVVLDI